MQPPKTDRYKAEIPSENQTVIKRQTTLVHALPKTNPMKIYEHVDANIQKEYLTTKQIWKLKTDS